MQIDRRTLSVAVFFVSFVSLVSLVWWWTSDERVITRRLADLADTLSVQENRGDLETVTRIARLRTFFAPDVRISVGPRTVVSRDALLALLSRWTPPPGGVTVRFVDVTVAVADAERTADVSLTAIVSGRAPATGEETVDAMEAAVGMSDAGGEWVITSVESRETLNRP
jgi:hypothetical protein